MSLSVTRRSFSHGERGVNSAESFPSGHQRKLTSSLFCQLEALTTQAVQTTKAPFHGQLDAVKASHCFVAGMRGRWLLPPRKTRATSLAVSGSNRVNGNKVLGEVFGVGDGSDSRMDRKGQISVKKHNYNMSKMMVFIAEQNKKLHV